MRGEGAAEDVWWRFQCSYAGGGSSSLVLSFGKSELPELPPEHWVGSELSHSAVVGSDPAGTDLEGRRWDDWEQYKLSVFSHY